MLKFQSGGKALHACRSCTQHLFKGPVLRGQVEDTIPELGSERLPMVALCQQLAATLKQYCD